MRHFEIVEDLMEDFGPFGPMLDELPRGAPGAEAETADDRFRDEPYDMTAGLGRLESLVALGDLVSAGELAGDLVFSAGRMEMRDVSRAAAELETCCLDGDHIAARAAALYLGRIGDAALAAATVD